MPTRYLPRIALLGVVAFAVPKVGHAALVQAPERDTPPATTLVAASQTAGLDLALSQTALQAGRAGQSICGEGVVCQEWDDLMDDAQSVLKFASLGPFGRMTFLANVALVAIGLVWAMLTRRSLRAARQSAERTRG